VNSKTNKINLNTALEEVLVAIPGMTSEIADAIINYRQVKEITSTAEIQGLLGENYNLMSPYFRTGRSNTFTIDSIGQEGEAKAGFGIRATVIIEGNNKYRYIYYKSPAYIKK
jgi:type II secretory pathway component PulK